MTESITERAMRARKALPNLDSLHPDDREAAITDLVTDLLHLAHCENLDPEALQRRAWHHFKAELHEAGVE